MSFQGTLDLFSIADILRLLAAGGKDGLLGLRREGASGGIWLSGGGVAWAATRPGPTPFARRLQGLGAVEPDALDAALREAVEGRSLAAVLLQSAAVPAERLHEIAMEHLVDELFDLARWPDGSFSFEQGERPPEALDPVAAVEELLAETERRLAAWPEIAGRVPGRSALLSIPPRSADATAVTVDPAEWRLLAAVGGRRTVASLVDETGQGEFQTCQALAAMVQRGLLAAAEEAEPEAAERVAAAQAAIAEVGPGGDAAGPAPAPGPGSEVEPEAEAEAGEPAPADAATDTAPADAATDAAQELLDRLISGVRGL